ncbi:MAG: transglutaminase domain-containing protein [Solobacterium sp.]|nr:transglutaminase domain-containing protein [Solobacterium sp.]
MEKYIKDIADSYLYTNEPFSFHILYIKNEKRASEICTYFKQQAGIDLDSLASENTTTWEKTKKLATFVAENIPHNNQLTDPEEINAISLWEYSRQVPSGFNCRLHAIMLFELLESIGIRNIYITCQPKDHDDTDCHVVNHVWLPETQKWAMIDSDLAEYMTDSSGTPLSLPEIRKELFEGNNIYPCILPVYIMDGKAEKDYIDYLKLYWAKNLYWFAVQAEYGFHMENEQNHNIQHICLIPPGYNCKHVYKDAITTSNSFAFWDLLFE